MHRSLKQLHEWACIVAVTLVAVSTVHAEEGAIKPLDEQPNKEQVAQLPVADAESAPSAPAVVPIILPESIIIEVHAEKGYINESGNYVLDLLEQDMAYLAVQLKTVHGQLVEGVQPTFSITGKSRLVSPEETSDRNTTDEYGVIEFGVIGGKMGLDQVTVEFAGASTTILVNVISLESLGFPRLPTVEGLVAWGDLMRTRIKFEDRRLIAEFPEEIANLAGKSVKLVRFHDAVGTDSRAESIPPYFQPSKLLFPHPRRTDRSGRSLGPRKRDSILGSDNARGTIRAAGD